MKPFDELKKLEQELKRRNLPVVLPSRLQILWVTLKQYLTDLFRRK